MFFTRHRLNDSSAKSDATSLRSFQTAFFCDTLLQALEVIFKESSEPSQNDNNNNNNNNNNGDLLLREPPPISQAVNDMVVLFESAGRQ